MKTTCKQCRRKFNSLQEAMGRSCDMGNCRLQHGKEESMAAKVKTDVIIPAFTTQPQIKQRVIRVEDEPKSNVDNTKPHLFIEVPRAIVIKIYPKGKRA